MIINKGDLNGIKENMPVVSYRNGRKVIGKILATTHISSKIITINNPALSVGVVIDNNIHCIIKGAMLR